MLLATLLALGSAALHAGWNLIVKTSDDRDLATWAVFLIGGLLVAPLLLVFGGPGWAGVPYLVGSGLIHVVYVTALARAYHHGDFSLAYPLARGGGALVAALGGVLLLGDHLSAAQIVGVLVVGAGLLSLVGRGASAASIGWALLTAATIGCYTIVDSRGSRLSDDGVRYGLALMPFSAAFISVSMLAQGRGPALATAMRVRWRQWAVGSVLLTTAYTMVMVAVRQPGAAVGYVSMLRESSVVMAALAGWVLLRESLGRHRLVSSAVIVVGLVTLIAFRP